MICDDKIFIKNHGWKASVGYPAIDKLMPFDYA
jgi:hypothetical protein